MTSEPWPGRVAPAVAAEHPDLGLWLATTPLASGPPDEGVLHRLRELSDRFGGAQAAVLRTKAVPHAHRAFFRQVGLDPDRTRSPVEAVVAERLLRGGLVSRDRLSDAVTVAVMETGVGVWALDADAVAGVPELRTAGPGEAVGDGAPLPEGRLVVADDAGPLAVLFDAPARARPVRGARELLLYAIQVPGVSALAVGEALWIAGEIAGGS